jgi:uncharacterized DUF497 family protein
VDFDWDEAKAAGNLRKHGIAFASVSSAFLDLYGIADEDRDREYGEQRMRLIAMVNGVVLVISYTERDDAIRLISARRANRHEQKIYDRNRTRRD